jgi:hypothetical protein
MHLSETTRLSMAAGDLAAVATIADVHPRFF